MKNINNVAIITIILVIVYLLWAQRNQSDNIENLRLEIQKLQTLKSNTRIKGNHSTNAEAILERQSFNEFTLSEDFYCQIHEDSIQAFKFPVAKSGDVYLYDIPKIADDINEKEDLQDVGQFELKRNGIHLTVRAEETEEDYHFDISETDYDGLIYSFFHSHASFSSRFCPDYLKTNTSL